MKSLQHAHVVLLTQCQKRPHKVTVKAPPPKQPIHLKEAHIGNNCKNMDLYMTIIHPSERRAERLRCSVQVHHETDAASDSLGEVHPSLMELNQTLSDVQQEEKQTPLPPCISGHQKYDFDENSMHKEAAEVE